VEIVDFNPWWETGAIDRDTAPMKRRDLFPTLKESRGGDERSIEAERVRIEIVPVSKFLSVQENNDYLIQR
jgi:hypothetical protein